MDLTTIMVSCITMIGTMVTSFAGILVANKLTNYRISQLEKKVEKHNNMVERVYVLEEQEKILEEKEKVTGHRLSDLERLIEKIR